MGKRLRVAFLFSLAALGSTYAFGKDHAYQAGRLLDAQTDERLHEGTSLRRAIYTVQVADIVYTLQGERVKQNTKDITKGLIIGDPVQASVEKDHVYLRTANGKDMKTDVLKRARVQQAQ